MREVKCLSAAWDPSGEDEGRWKIDFLHPLQRDAIRRDNQDSIIRLKGREPKSDIIVLPKHSRVADLYLYLQKMYLMGDDFITRAQRWVYVLA